MASRPCSAVREDVLLGRIETDRAYQPSRHDFAHREMLLPSTSATAFALQSVFATVASS
jgi:hypothetical protein